MNKVVVDLPVSYGNVLTPSSLKALTEKLAKHGVPDHAKIKIAKWRGVAVAVWYVG